MSSPAEIVRTARAGHAVVGWKLSSHARDNLLLQLPPRYEKTIADHITLSAKVASGTPTPEDCRGEIVGRIDDGVGVEALVLEIEGSHTRPDGGTWHITWSLAAGRRPNDSNDVLAGQQWSPLEEPIKVQLKGARIR